MKKKKLNLLEKILILFIKILDIQKNSLLIVLLMIVKMKFYLHMMKKILNGKKFLEI